LKYHLPIFLNVLETSVELVFGDCDAVRSSLLGVLLRVALLALRLAVLLVLTDKLSSVLDNDGEDFFFIRLVKSVNVFENLPFLNDLELVDNSDFASISSNLFVELSSSTPADSLSV